MRNVSKIKKIQRKHYQYHRIMKDVFAKVESSILSILKRKLLMAFGINKEDFNKFKDGLDGRHENTF